MQLETRSCLAAGGPVPRTVALVDDDATSLAIVGDMLAGAGYLVTRYRTGEEALAALWEGGADLVITDLFLPRMNGVRFAGELRRREWAASLPVVVVSALSVPDDEVALHVADGTFNAMLKKPLHEENLLEVVADLVAREAALGPRFRSSPTAQHAIPSPAVGTSRMEVRLTNPAEFIAEYSENLAHGGLFVRSDRPLPPKSEVVVSLSLPFRKAEFRLKGTVVRTILPGSPEASIQKPGMALAFFELPADLKLAMDAYVAGLRSGFAHYRAPPSPVTVVLVALREKLPAETDARLARHSGARIVHCANVEEALTVAGVSDVIMVATAATVLGTDPGRPLRELRQRVKQVVVVATAGAVFEAASTVLDSAVHPDLLLGQIADWIAVARRSAARVPCSCVAACTRSDGTFTAVLEDVSLTGVSLATGAACASGEKLLLDVELGTRTRIRAMVRVVRVAALSDGTVRVGAEFESFEGDTAEEVRRYVDSRSHLGALMHLLPAS